LSRTIKLASAGGTIEVADSANVVTVSTAISNDASTPAGGLTKTGPGTLTLTRKTLCRSHGGQRRNLDLHPPDYQVAVTGGGGVTINTGGTAVFQTVNCLYQTGFPNMLLTINGGTATMGGYHEHLFDTTMTGGTINSSGTASTMATTSQLDGKISVAGTAASTITLTSGLSIKTGAGPFEVLDPAGLLTVNAKIHNTDGAPSAVVKTGPGTMTLVGTQTYTGNTTVSGARSTWELEHLAERDP